jgi:hypothetical protein
VIIMTAAIQKENDWYRLGWDDGYEGRDCHPQGSDEYKDGWRDGYRHRVEDLELDDKLDNYLMRASYDE